MIGADKFVDTLHVDTQKVHATQRYQRGISDIDMWNLDSLIADVVVFGCDWMMANAHSTPWHLEQGQWHAILAQIRDGFSCRDDDSGGVNPPDEAWQLLKDNFKYMWD